MFHNIFYKYYYQENNFLDLDNNLSNYYNLFYRPENHDTFVILFISRYNAITGER